MVLCAEQKRLFICRSPAVYCFLSRKCCVHYKLTLKNAGTLARRQLYCKPAWFSSAEGALNHIHRATIYKRNESLQNCNVAFFSQRRDKKTNATAAARDAKSGCIFHFWVQIYFAECAPLHPTKSISHCDRERRQQIASWFHALAPRLHNFNSGREVSCQQLWLHHAVWLWLHPFLLSARRWTRNRIVSLRSAREPICRYRHGFRVALLRGTVCSRFYILMIPYIILYAAFPLLPMQLSFSQIKKQRCLMHCQVESKVVHYFKFA